MLNVAYKLREQSSASALRAVRIPLAAALLVILPLPRNAHAGPWAQEEGAWIEISDISYERYGDSLKQVGWRPGYYAEYGYRTATTLFLKIQAAAREEKLVQSTDIGLRMEMYRGNRAAASFEIEALLGENPFQPGCGHGIGARIALGTSYSLAGRHGFAAADASVRYRGDSCLRQKASAVLGFDPTPDWQVLGKAYYDGNRDIRSIKLEAALAQRIGANLTLGVGYRHEVGGQFQEHSGLIFIQRTGRFGGARTH